MRVAVAVGLFAALAFSTPSFAEGEIGRVKSVAGVATVTRGRDKPAQLAPGQRLRVSDVIQTDKDGALGITFLDNSRFAVGPNTNLALSQFEFDKTTHRGRFESQVNKGTVAIVSGQIAKENRGDAMRVRTPVSVLAARGTRFVVQVP